jgi:tetratricopeptide (TPR) repeat protein
MKRPIARHDWLVSACCAHLATRDDADAALLSVDAHRNLRGPFAAAGGVIRALIDDANKRAPELVATHLVTLLQVAPEIIRCVAVPAEVRDASAVSREGNPASWMRRIANGAVDFILGYFEGRRAFPAAVVFTNVDHADPADQEFIATLLRRADPKTLRLCICTASDRLPPLLAGALAQYATRRRQTPRASKASDVPKVWAAWFSGCGLGKDAAAGLWRDLSQYGQGSVVPPRLRALEPLLDEVVVNLAAAERDKLAREHVDSDGASQRILAAHVYRRLPAPEHAAMHLARATSLDRLGEASLALGAIPFHHEQAGGDAEKLLTASRRSLDMACYDAALEWAVRGRQMLAGTPRGKTYGDLTRQMLFALLLLGRYDEVERLCEDLLAQSEDAALLAHATYAMAILNARLYEKSRRDYDAAKSWIERSQAFTDATPASPTRVVNAAFLMNTMALVEMRKGRVDIARQKLADALALMSRDAPELYRNESAILLHNLARLAVATGGPDLAIGHLSTLLSQQPGDSSAWFDRGLIHQRAGRHDAALSDYDAAIQWEPAHAEAHFNRAQTLVALNRRDEAIDAYARVIVLQPDTADARLNRAILLCERGDLAPARDEIEQAIQPQPGDARMLCTLGLIEMRIGDHDAAAEAFARSIKADPALADPWANRATIAFKRGDFRSAIDDLTRALALREDAAILCNRAKVFEAKRQWQKAADDYAQARTLAGANTEAIERRYQRCIEAMRQTKPHSRSSSRSKRAGA